MPIMPAGERLLCRTAAWGALVRPMVPWALSGQRLHGDVLEIGAGGGGMAVGMLRRFGDITLTVADLDPRMVHALERRLDGFGSRALARVADATSLPFPDASFDAVVSCLMLHHVGNWEAAVSEVSRVLRPGGRFVGYDLHDTVVSRVIHRIDGIRDLRSVTGTTLADALHANGFGSSTLREKGLTVRWVAERG